MIQPAGGNRLLSGRSTPRREARRRLTDRSVGRCDAEPRDGVPRRGVIDRADDRTIAVTSRDDGARRYVVGESRWSSPGGGLCPDAVVSPTARSVDFDGFTGQVQHRLGSRAPTDAAGDSSDPDDPRTADAGGSSRGSRRFAADGDALVPDGGRPRTRSATASDSTGGSSSRASARSNAPTRLKPRTSRGSSSISSTRSFRRPVFNGSATGFRGARTTRSGTNRSRWAMPVVGAALKGLRPAVGHDPRRTAARSPESSASHVRRSGPSGRNYGTSAATPA